MPMPQPTAGVGLAAELLEEAVVATAAADRALRAEPVRHPLEHGEVVVVEAAHEARVDAVLEPGGVEDAPHRAEVRERVGAEEIDQPRRAFDHRLQRRVLAVEDAQRIAVQSPPRVLVERSRRAARR